jgi:type III restriction enzyme
MPGVIDKVNAAADAKRVGWIAHHKAAINGEGEKYKQALRDIEGGGGDPELTTISMPNELETRKGTELWDKHLYVDPGSKKFPADFNSWEQRAIETELKRTDVVGWLRNLDRKPWSVCIPRRDGPRWRGIYPDFIFFRKTASGIIADIVDPHLLDDKDAPARAAALAEYASKHISDYGRIEMLIYENRNDPDGKRIDLMDEKMRKRVAKVKDHAHLRDIFDNP